MIASHMNARTATAYRPDAPVDAGRGSADPALGQNGSVVYAARNKAVIEQGQPASHVFKVVAGALRTVRLLPDGRRHVGGFLLPGDVFGFTQSDEYDQSVEVVADATLVRYPRHSIEALLRTNGAANRHLIGLLSGQLAATQGDLLLLGCKSAVERLASFLLMLADRRLAGKRGAHTVELPMKRGDIADYLGMTAETVSRIFTQLRHQRIIDLPSTNQVVFLKRAALEALCGDRG